MAARRCGVDSLGGAVAIGANAISSSRQLGKTLGLVYAVVIAVIRNAASLREAPRRFIVHNTHEQIQLAAVRVVAAKGYHQTSVRDICAEAHISARSFHEHFASKEEAVFSGIEAGVDSVMGFGQEIYKSSTNWPDAVWDGMHAYAEWIVKRARVRPHGDRRAALDRALRARAGAVADGRFLDFPATGL